MITGIDINTYFIKEPKRAIAFWRDTMGLTATDLDEDHGAEFELPDGTTFGIWKVDEMPWTPAHGIMFAVPDIAAAVSYYRGRGVSIAPGIDESPVCWMAFAEDSEGNHFILHQRKTP